MLCCPSDPPVVESQPTQLLQNVLGGGMEPPRIPHHRQDTNLAVEDPNVTKDSFDSSSSSVRHSTNRYHFHGLAATQTQMQHDDCAEGSCCIWVCVAARPWK